MSRISEAQPTISPSDAARDLLPTDSVMDEILRVSVLMLMFYAGSSWAQDIPLKIACAAALLFRPVLWSVVWWAVVTSIIALVNGMAWHSIDNHKYLIFYWALCVGMAVASPRTAGRMLALNARLLVGACFAFAVLWKLLAMQYFDGRFLLHTFLTDSRVEVGASIAGGVPLPEFAANRGLMGMLAAAPSSDLTVVLAGSERLRRIAVVASYWTLAIESAISLLWLVPRWSAGIAKDAALTCFILTTYFLLPVVGFATILGVLGYVHAAARNRRRTRLVYLLIIALVQLASAPWTSYASFAAPT